MNLEQQWAAAVDVFFRTPEGMDWPGGELNQQRMGRMLQKMGLMDAENKVDALVQAYKELKKSGDVTPRTLGPVTFGRWEYLTDFDRRMLHDMGIQS